nr:uncharacterized protein LOC124814899 [Hydra vulgaris]
MLSILTWFKAALSLGNIISIGSFVSRNCNDKDSGNPTTNAKRTVSSENFANQASLFKSTKNTSTLSPPCNFRFVKNSYAQYTSNKNASRTGVGINNSPEKMVAPSIMQESYQQLLIKLEITGKARRRCKDADDWLSGCRKLELSGEKGGDRNRKTSLKAVAVKLRVNVQLVHEAVISAVKKRIQNTQDVIIFVRDTLVKKATNFQCTDALTAEQCDEIALIGKNLKLSAIEVAKAVRQAVARPVEVGVKLYVAVLFILDDLKKNVKCETFVSEDVCKKVANYAISLKLSAEDATKAVKEAILQGANNAADYYNKATEYLRAQISCENVLSVEGKFHNFFFAFNDIRVLK